MSMGRDLRVGALVAALCAALVLASCSSRDESKAREVVEGYNQALVRMYAEEDIARIGPFVTKEQLDAAARALHLAMFKGLIMKSEITSLDIKGVSRGPDGEYLVDTDESWVYSLQQKASGAITKGPEEAHYRNRYHVVVSEGAYLINGIDIGTE